MWGKVSWSLGSLRRNYCHWQLNSKMKCVFCCLGEMGKSSTYFNNLPLCQITQIRGWLPYQTEKLSQGLPYKGQAALTSVSPKWGPYQSPCNGSRLWLDLAADKNRYYTLILAKRLGSLLFVLELLFVWEKCRILANHFIYLDAYRKFPIRK